jgi:predicted MFS family arabinose efflux permease
LTGFLLSAAIGILIGGVLADRNVRHSLVIFVGMLGAASLFAVVGLTAAMSATGLLVTIGIAGFLFGITTPSRDMLVRSATPKGATGRVFGFVYSGLDAGAAMAPVFLGILLDGGQPVYVIWFTAAAMFFAIFTAISVRGRRAEQEAQAVRA